MYLNQIDETNGAKSVPAYDVEVFAKCECGKTITLNLFDLLSNPEILDRCECGKPFAQYGENVRVYS